LQKLSTSEVALRAGKSPRQIRNLCKEGKLPCHKEEISTGDKYWIYTNTEEFKKLCGNDSMLDSVIDAEVVEGNEETREGNNQSLKEIIAFMQNRNEVLAREAGKVELLTDNLISKEKDTKYWQDKFFEEQHKAEEARKELALLSAEVGKLQTENEKLKQKSFFGIKWQ